MVSERIGWILNNACGDSNYIGNIPLLTDDDLLYCLNNERRATGLAKLRAEKARRDKLKTKE